MSNIPPQRHNITVPSRPAYHKPARFAVPPRPAYHKPARFAVPPRPAPKLK